MSNPGSDDARSSGEGMQKGRSAVAHFDVVRDAVTSLFGALDGEETLRKATPGDADRIHAIAHQFLDRVVHAEKSPRCQVLQEELRLDADEAVQSYAKVRDWHDRQHADPESRDAARKLEEFGREEREQAQARAAHARSRAAELRSEASQESASGKGDRADMLRDRADTFDRVAATDERLASSLNFRHNPEIDRLGEAIHEAHDDSLAELQTSLTEDTKKVALLGKFRVVFLILAASALAGVSLLVGFDQFWINALSAAVGLVLGEILERSLEARLDRNLTSNLRSIAFQVAAAKALDVRHEVDERELGTT